MGPEGGRSLPGPEPGGRATPPPPPEVLPSGNVGVSPGPGRLRLVRGVVVSVSDDSVLGGVSVVVGGVVVVGVSGGFCCVVVTSLTSLPIALTLSNFSAGLPL